MSFSGLLNHYSQVEDTLLGGEIDNLLTEFLNPQFFSLQDSTESTQPQVPPNLLKNIKKIQNGNITAAPTIELSEEDFFEISGVDQTEVSPQNGSKQELSSSATSAFLSTEELESALGTVNLDIDLVQNETAFQQAPPPQVHVVQQPQVPLVATRVISSPTPQVVIAQQPASTVYPAFAKMESQGFFASMQQQQPAENNSFRFSSFFDQQPAATMMPIQQQQHSPVPAYPTSFGGYVYQNTGGNNSNAFFPQPQQLTHAQPRLVPASTTTAAPTPVPMALSMPNNTTNPMTMMMMSFGPPNPQNYSSMVKEKAETSFVTAPAKSSLSIDIAGIDLFLKNYHIIIPSNAAYGTYLNQTFRIKVSGVQQHMNTAALQVTPLYQFNNTTKPFNTISCLKESVQGSDIVFRFDCDFKSLYLKNLKNNSLKYFLKFTFSVQGNWIEKDSIPFKIISENTYRTHVLRKLIKDAQFTSISPEYGHLNSEIDVFLKVSNYIPHRDFPPTRSYFNVIGVRRGTNPVMDGVDECRVRTCDIQNNILTLTTQLKAKAEAQVIDVYIKTGFYERPSNVTVLKWPGKDINGSKEFRYLAKSGTSMISNIIKSTESSPENNRQEDKKRLASSSVEELPKPAAKRQRTDSYNSPFFSGSYLFDQFMVDLATFSNTHKVNSTTAFNIVAGNYRFQKDVFGRTVMTHLLARGKIQMASKLYFSHCYSMTEPDCFGYTPTDWGYLSVFNSSVQTENNTYGIQFATPESRAAIDQLEGPEEEEQVSAPTVSVTPAASSTQARPLSGQALTSASTPPISPTSTQATTEIFALPTEAPQQSQKKKFIKSIWKNLKKPFSGSTHSLDSNEDDYAESKLLKLQIKEAVGVPLQQTEQENLSYAIYFDYKEHQLPKVKAEAVQEQQAEQQQSQQRFRFNWTENNEWSVPVSRANSEKDLYFIVYTTQQGGNKKVLGSVKFPLAPLMEKENNDVQLEIPTESNEKISIRFSNSIISK